MLLRDCAINHRDAIQPAFDGFPGIADQVLAVDLAAAERAKEILMGNRQMSARDAVHLAVIRQCRPSTSPRRGQDAAVGNKQISDKGKVKRKMAKLRNLEQLRGPQADLKRKLLIGQA